MTAGQKNGLTPSELDSVLTELVSLSHHPGLCNDPCIICRPELPAGNADRIRAGGGAR